MEMCLDISVEMYLNIRDTIYKLSLLTTDF
eukprot:SAG22_NODE_6924_length_794_cov_1.870504_1_plen_30_part_00